MNRWINGYSVRFGLTYVNYSDPYRQRIPKQSLSWFQNYISSFSSNLQSQYEVSSQSPLSIFERLYEFWTPFTSSEDIILVSKDGVVSFSNTIKGILLSRWVGGP
jgi:hypothetical protein